VLHNFNIRVPFKCFAFLLNKSHDSVMLSQFVKLPWQTYVELFVPCLFFINLTMLHFRPNLLDDYFYFKPMLKFAALCSVSYIGYVGNLAV